MRVHSWVAPMSTVLPTFTSPARAASLSAIGMASSRLPSRMSTVGTISGSFDDHLLVLRREEVDHPAGAERDLADGLGGTDGERLEEVTGAAHDLQG